MEHSRAYDPTDREQVFDTLRREILAARLKITLDRELNRPTSDMVIRLANMKLPPITYNAYNRNHCNHCNHDCCRRSR